MSKDRFVKQLDGCTYCSGGQNCTCACHAMWLYRASGGRIVLSACQVRVMTGDRIGGTNLHQMASISAHYGISGTLWTPGSFDQLRDRILTGRFGTHVQIGYAALANTDYDCFDGAFRGGHDVYVASGTANYARIGDPGADGRRATIPEGWQDIPWELLERAASALPLSSGGPTLAQEYGSGRVYAYLTPADPMPATFLVSITGYTNLYDRPFGSRVGAVTAATYVSSRTKVSGQWWYRIVSKADGSRTANAGRYFTPNRHTIARPM